MEVRPVTMPRCTNKWSTPNKDWWHLGKRTPFSMVKKTNTAATIFLRTDYDEQGSYSARVWRPHQGPQNVGMMAASSNFNSSDFWWRFIMFAGCRVALTARCKTLDTSQKNKQPLLVRVLWLMSPSGGDTLVTQWLQINIMWSKVGWGTR